MSVHDTQNASTLNQDRMKQVELEKTANQVGEGQNKHIDMGVTEHKACFLSKLPPVLTLQVLRFKNNEKRMEHVKFEENLDVGDYLDLRCNQFYTSITNTFMQFEVSDLCLLLFVS